MNEAIKLLKEAKQALYNRDAIKCYDSGSIPCECTVCKIDKFIKENEKKQPDLFGS